MNGNKLFIASIIVLALALGFFAGRFCNFNCCSSSTTCCQKGGPCACSQGLPCACEKNGQPCHCPNCAKHENGEHKHMGEKHHGPKFKGGMNPAAMDSLLQVTPEQKAAIEASRAKGDSIFRELRKQKHEAEKALGEALESKDSAGIDAAKARVLDVDKSLLEHRINGMQALAGILTAEQLEKFNAFHKEQMKNFRERMKNGPHRGPHGGHEHGNPPPPPPAN
ncbi:protein refolding chaperone Spy/CpxP family [Fibrobacter sp. UWB15]|uniref:Spy/CpxP family protein refolding chaperone n=1 Tax=unclassified Fibrobacter TaxID=2634177 RepID=UPI0009100E2A|nr:MULTISPECIES: Spy/CpxP family protein refolding chaperone [unclassified Fibrobacter]PWJ63528.1 Spy/CpxP family protein refolding chaperone [Fibrobacter sp. UWB6]SHG29694.1 protein refolding chaperone Spy/CpxP family [Fibrobacter sp. UWB8]SMG36880.1 protein refolding chaperone Spy/CpxP family [Fibrobacter sp. UWB15]